ncbi:hypothetical protein PCS_03466 [Desulfocurvibacter africanus PCS]|uniref:Uncharacterized protein n=1 Tax=Desulfocurvibacter africanus PCS TaxID=1262666 RepID=M5Q0L0_DESAF|nr:hypothetical protein PCS_03466 [Desulfocurvibacter africanus PCS]
MAGFPAACFSSKAFSETDLSMVGSGKATLDFRP